MKKLIIATKNKGKVRDFQNFLGADFQIISLDEINTLFDLDIDTEETADTFEGNAKLKAYDLYKNLEAKGLTNFSVVADDSGLCVDFLNGNPGVYSARYAGNHDDKANNEKLIHELHGIPKEKRTAYYITCLVYVSENVEKIVYGKFDGYILDEERGSNGFAYDTLFECKESGKVYAEMSDDERANVSHRNKALKNLQKVIAIS